MNFLQLTFEILELVFIFFRAILKTDNSIGLQWQPFPAQTTERRRLLMDHSTVFVCLMGMGTVFFGLVCLILLTRFMGFLFTRPKKAPVQEQSVSGGPRKITPAEIIAITAAIEDDLGMSLSDAHLTITSMAIAG